MIYKRYSDEDYTRAYLSLNQEQREVLDYYVKVGYRTKWLYILAIKKGLILKEEELIEKSSEEIDKIYQSLEWSLIDYTDYLKRNNNAKCECGRSLRHAYTVKHNPTGKIYILGTNHFEQYTSISSNDVKDILSNFKLIDLEKTEMLGKIIEHRDIDVRIKINKNYVIPTDMAKQLEVNLPLLDRQLKRLKNGGAFSDYEDKIKSDRVNRISKDNLINPDYQRFQKVNSDRNTDYINNRNIEMEKPDFEIDIQEMIKKFQTRTCTVEEANIYLKYFIYYKNSLNKLSLDRNAIEKALYRILGNLQTGALRATLVEIGSIICPGF